MAEPVLNTPFFSDIDEFLRWADGREERFEFVEGRVRAMAPTSDAHALIAMNVGVALHGRLAGTSCRVYGTGFAVVTRGRTRDNARLPDAAVACRGAAPGERRVVLVIEVLSPSTEGQDLDAKRAEYLALSDLNHYLVLAQHKPHAILYSRRDGNRLVEDFDGLEANVPLAGLGITLPLAEVYDGVDFGFDA